MDRGLQALIDVLQEPCFILEQDGGLLAANKAALAALELRDADLAGRRLETVVANDPQQLRAYLASSMRSTSPTVGAVTIVTARGQSLEFRAEGARYQASPDSRPALFLRLTPKATALNQFETLNQRLEALSREVSRRRLAEIALASKVAELSEAHNNQNRFLATLSHELRNPLSPIRNGIFLLMGKLGDDQRDDVVLMLERHVAHLVRLLDDLLDVSRVTNGKVSLRVGSVAVKQVVELAVESVREKVAASGQVLDVRINEAIVLRADVDRARQIVANLLDNASKYSPAGGRISLAAQVERGQAAIRVTDSGPGVPLDLQERLFQFFEQGHQSGTQGGGLGLGLALSRTLAELQGGQLELEPQRGEGACFCLRLPLEDAARPRRDVRDATASAS